jgi:protein ImuB
MARRILSLWLPRMASEQALRRLGARMGGLDGTPFAIILRAGGRDVIACLNPAAEARGLRRGQPLSEARALEPGLITRLDAPLAQAQLLAALCRWALAYAPWVGPDGADGLVLDITGAAHLRGGEEALAEEMRARLAAMGFGARLGLAGTRGAAWALARHGRAPLARAAPGAERAALEGLPLAALRLPAQTCAALARLGLRQVRDLAALPRAPLVRRFGAEVALRLDQALGGMPEPVSPAPPPAPLAIRLTLPEPIGRVEDVMAGLERLLERLCTRLAERGQGARRLKLELRRCDMAHGGGHAEAEVALARPMRDAPAMAALFRRAVEALDAGFGFDALRLSAPEAEALAPAQLQAARGRVAADDMADLMTRLGGRMGLEALIRFLPGQSHIPERAFQVASAVFAPAPDPADWPDPAARAPRPLVLFPPEPVEVLVEARAEGAPRPPRRFLWRRRRFRLERAHGPERLTPEWWLDDPLWRSGMRDYWRVETAEGPRLWLFHTPQEPGWAVQGEFA